MSTEIHKLSVRKSLGAESASFDHDAAKAAALAWLKLRNACK